MVNKNQKDMYEKSLDNYSIQEYLELDSQSNKKNEYNSGLIIALVEQTLNHGIIGNNINSEINGLLKEKDLKCTSINGDVRVYIEKANSYVYQDGMVICGKIETSEEDENSVINPVLIIEVLSKSTESYDRGNKFHKYCSLKSFCEYVLIDQYKPVIDTLYRADKTYWKMVTTIGLDKSIYLHSIQAHIKMSDIYRNVGKLDNPQFSLDF